MGAHIEFLIILVILEVNSSALFHILLTTFTHLMFFFTFSSIYTSFALIYGSNYYSFVRIGFRIQFHDIKQKANYCRHTYTQTYGRYLNGNNRE